MVTIRDVARLANVSVATVSAVTNGKGGVSAKLVRRVEHAVEALDYHPSHVARSLKVRWTQTIGMIIPDITNPFFSDVIRGVESVARPHGYSLILCDSNEDPAQDTSNLNTLFSRRVDGVLVAPSDPRVAQDRFTRRRFPMVLFDRVPAMFTGSAVVADNVAAAFEATRHLIAIGHRRIAIITGRLNMSSGLDRLEGFRRALQQAGLPLREEHMRQGDFQLDAGYRCGLELLRLENRPTAIFCCNNQMTLGLMRAFAEMRVSCPAHISVLGFDDFDWAANFSPRLTTVAQPSFEMGCRAMDLLFHKIDAAKTKTGEDEERVIVLSASLRVRDSTAPPPEA